MIINKLFELKNASHDNPMHYDFLIGILLLMKGVIRNGNKKI